MRIFDYSISNIIVLFLFPPIFPISALIFFLYDIFILGKSKTGIRKIKKQYTLKQRMFLQHIKENHNKYDKDKNVMLFALKAYSISFLLGLVFLFVSVWYSWAKTALIIQIIIRGILLDIPTVVYDFIVTEHDKVHGGCKSKYRK